MPLPALNQPLSWKSSDPDVVAVLNDVQANILKGHARLYTTHLFLAFAPGREEQIRAAIHQLSGQLKCARQQLAEAEAYRNSSGKKDGGTLRCFFLTFAGYKALGIPEKAPAGRAFREGMKNRDVLHDDPTTWEADFRKEIHAMLLLADDKKGRLDADARSLLASLEAAGVSKVVKEDGHQLVNESEEFVEHFGHVDGRSQPLLLQEDVEAERMKGDSMWDPSFPANKVLVTGGGRVLGSFLVFRKIEQNVAAFRAARSEVAKALGLRDKGAAALASALMIGRFPDGTPVVLRKEAGFGGEPMNNFNYDDDPSANKCPVHAHTRKVNPRGTSEEPIWLERRHVVARRGITYGKRRKGLGDAPQTGVGILFMAYQTQIEEQFEFIQAKWASEATFPPRAGQPAPGIDPIIGVHPKSGKGFPPKKRSRGYAKEWGGSTPAASAGRRKAKGAAHGVVDVDEPKEAIVTVKGGEYFFAPVLSDLRTL